jgi:hypothetical protein
MILSTILRRGSAVAAAFATAATTTTALAATYNYVNWTSADVGGGTASGTIALSGDAGVDVTFTATTADGGAGDFYGAQTGGSGTTYWTPAATYQSSAVENAPPTSDIIQLAGGENETYTVDLSQPIVDPIMAIVSLGASGAPITYNFDSPFTIVSQGTDDWGGSSTSLAQLPGNVLQGAEGSGVIQFIGTYSRFSWTVPSPESWHGFTFGILTSAALYDGGGPDGSTTVIVGDDAGSDGGTSLQDAGDDAATSSDATTPDAGAPSDSGVTPEASTVPDAGSEDDATTGNSDSSIPTGNQGPVSETSSCGCRTAGAGRGWASGLGSFGTLLAAAGLLRRRRR